jgi:predicted HTH transcriptional regulator
MIWEDLIRKDLNAKNNIIRSTGGLMEPQELRLMLKDLESDLIERKASLSDPDRIRQAICTFANDLPDHRRPGIIFIGANDGSCAGLHVTDDLLLKLSQMRDDGKIQPGVTDYRNPHLAEAMRVLGYVQRFGLGIQIARQQLAANGNPPPVFIVEQNHILATIRR